jgi:hypothetical protein
MLFSFSDFPNTIFSNNYAMFLYKCKVWEANKGFYLMEKLCFFLSIT